MLRRLVPLALLLAAASAHPARADAPTMSQRATVVTLSASYIGSALLGAHLAIRDTLHEAPFGWRSDRDVRTEFLRGTGTALSPSLPAIVAQAAVTGFVSAPPEQARNACKVLSIGGVLFAVGQLSEPLAWHVLLHPRRAPRERLLVVVGNIVLPATLAIVAADAAGW